MAIFTKAEDLFPSANEEQSVGGDPIEGGGVGYENKRIYQPNAGLDVVVKNPNWTGAPSESFPTGIVDSFDKRKVLGTITINNRDWWENSNYNEQSFQPYLTDEKKIVFNQEVRIDGNGEEIIVNRDRDNSGYFKFSIDALPFVINPNTNEIIRLDRYHDKKIHSEEYSLATEGKINFYIYPRVDGRTPSDNIDTFAKKGRRTVDNSNIFDVYADDLNSSRGYHLFRLDWGDGTPLEHTRETKVLEGSTLLEHIYEKPGFYTIKGVVMAFDGTKIGSWERFETTILINASPNYDVDLFDYENFATIGGISSDSVLVKSATDIIGINPLTFNDEKSSTKLIENINLFDRLNIYNFLTKVSSSILDKYTSDFEDYAKEIFDYDYDTLVTETDSGFTSGQIIGCMDPQASNYDPNAQSDLSVGTACEYGLTFKLVAPQLTNRAGGPLDVNFKIKLFLVNDMGQIMGVTPEDSPWLLQENKTLTGQYNPSNPDAFDGEVELLIGYQNPNPKIGRKRAYEQALGQEWIDYGDLESRSSKVEVETNPANESNRTKNISKSQLINAERIFMVVEPPPSYGQDAVTYDTYGFSVNVGVVPHSEPDAEGLQRLQPELGFNIVDNVYDDVSAAINRDTVGTQIWSTYPHPDSSRPDYTENLRTTTIGDGGFLQYDVFSPAGINNQNSYVDEFNSIQYYGLASDWIIEKTKMSVLELDISQLQNPGATADGGINGTFTLNINFEYQSSEGDSSDGGFGIPGP